MTGKWVVDLKAGGAGAVSVPQRYNESTADEFPDDMRNWVDKMFDDFERYMFEYNKTVPHADLRINSERPTFIKSQLASTRYTSGHQATTFFQGHLYTRYWALLIKGEETEVKAYVMPVDFLIGFETRQDEFKSYFEMRAAQNKKDRLVWHIDAVPISFEGIPSISKALFSALVKATKGELKDSERFRLTSPEIQNFSTDTTNFIQRTTLPPGTPAYRPQESSEFHRPALPPPAPPQPQPHQNVPGMAPPPPNPFMQPQQPGMAPPPPNPYMAPQQNPNMLPPQQNPAMPPQQQNPMMFPQPQNPMMPPQQQQNPMMPPQQQQNPMMPPQQQ
ncbi:MAG: hypothetical protein ACRD3W_02255, partial [Terriglobales bacterium]